MSDPKPPTPPGDLDGARENVEFLRAMRLLEVRPAPRKAARQADTAPAAPAARRIVEEDALFEAHMARIFSGAPEPAKDAPPSPPEPGVAAAPAADAAAPRATADAERDAEEDALFAHYIRAVDRGDAPPVAREPEVRIAADPDPQDAPQPPADAVDQPPKDPLLHGSAKALLRRLRKGEVTPRAEVDLHRLNRNEAINRLDAFLRESVSLGREVVLVITGRGNHSVDLGVLREMVPVLLRRRWPGLVRECLGAPRHLGGEGACVVFLRRNER